MEIIQITEEQAKHMIQSLWERDNLSNRAEYLKVLKANGYIKQSALEDAKQKFYAMGSKDELPNEVWYYITELEKALGE